jgi:hypothetical protein
MHCGKLLMRSLANLTADFHAVSVSCRAVDELPTTYVPCQFHRSVLVFFSGEIGDGVCMVISCTSLLCSCLANRVPFDAYVMYTTPLLLQTKLNSKGKKFI